MLTDIEIKRPWGKYVTHYSDCHYFMRTLYLNPGEELSWASHAHRNEVLILISGDATITTYFRDLKRKMELYRAECILVGVKHSIKNDSDTKVAVITELATGEKVLDEDVTRHEDRYGRAD